MVVASSEERPGEAETFIKLLPAAAGIAVSASGPAPQYGCACTR